MCIFLLFILNVFCLKQKHSDIKSCFYRNGDFNLLIFKDMTQILLKRIYEQPAPQDGYRILLDRMWPRGITKEKADYDEWRKDITPSSDLRHWFHEDPENNWQTFKTRYEMEIKQNPDFISFIQDIKKHPVVTFLTAAKDLNHCHLPILKAMIEKTL